VTLHFAQSLDGRIGLGKDREPALLSSDEGVTLAHRARSRHDAVLIGIDTLLHDDPLLTVRGDAEGRPLRVVLDSALRTPVTARLLKAGDDAGQAVVIGSVERAEPQRKRALEQAGAEVWLAPADAHARVGLSYVLAWLGERGVSSLLVEGGARVLTSFLREGLATRAEIEVAPLWLGVPATPALAELGVTGLGQAPRLARLEIERLGQSVLLTGDVLYPRQSS